MEEIMKGIKEVERDSLLLNHLHLQHPSPFSICPEVNRKSMSKAKEQFDAVASLVDYFVSLFDDVDKENKLATPKNRQYYQSCWFCQLHIYRTSHQPPLTIHNTQHPVANKNV
jgi:hypothetical protein